MSWSGNFGQGPGRWTGSEDQRFRNAVAAGADLSTIRSYYSFYNRSDEDLIQRANFLRLNFRTGAVQSGPPQQSAQHHGLQNPPPIGQLGAHQRTGQAHSPLGMPTQATSGTSSSGGLHDPRGPRLHTWTHPQGVPIVQGTVEDHLTPPRTTPNQGQGMPSMQRGRAGFPGPPNRGQGMPSMQRGRAGFPGRPNQGQGSFANQSGSFSRPQSQGFQSQSGPSHNPNIGNITQSFGHSNLGSTIPASASGARSGTRFDQPPAPQPPQKPPVSTTPGHVRNQTSYPPLPSMSQAHDASDPQTLHPSTAPEPQLPPAIPEVSPEVVRNFGSIYTCKVKTSYESPGTILLDMNPGQNTMSIFTGQLGFIYGWPATDPSGDSYVQFNLANTNLVGWVPEANLEIGTPKRPVQLVTNDWTSNVIVTGAATRLEKTLDALFSAIERNKGIIADEGGFMATIDHLCDQHAQRYRSKIVECMPTSIRQTIQDGRYSFEKLWNLPDSPEYTINSWQDKRAGIYTILVRDINGKNLIYHGKSKNMGNRFAAHRHALRKDSTVAGQLYDVCRRRRREQDWKMLMWTDFSNEPSHMHSKLMQVAEFASVVLDKSWNPHLFNVHSGGKEEYILDKNHAQLFSKMADDIFKETKWEPPTDCIGGNWETPLMDKIWKRTTWVRQDVILESGNTVNVYRRGPLRAFDIFNDNEDRANHRKIVLFHGGSDARGEVVISSSLLPLDVDIYPVIEYYEGENQRHPYPAFNVSEPGPTSDWLELNRVGIYLQWRAKDGRWKFIWWQSQRQLNLLGWPIDMKASIPDRHKDAYNHTTDLYVKARLIIDTIKQVRYSNPEDVWPWIKEGPLIVVKVVTYDHLQQTLALKDQEPLSRVVPTLRSFQENMNFIIYHYREPRGTLFIGSPPQGAGPRVQNPIVVPVRCYMCLGYAEQGGDSCGNLPEINQGPVQNQRKASCRNCNLYRRPCAWILGMGAKDRGKNPKYYWLGRPLPIDAVVRDCTGPSPIAALTFLGDDGEDEA